MHGTYLTSSRNPLFTKREKAKGTGEGKRQREKAKGKGRRQKAKGEGKRQREKAKGKGKKQKAKGEGKRQREKEKGKGRRQKAKGEGKRQREKAKGKGKRQKAKGEGKRQREKAKGKGRRQKAKEKAKGKGRRQKAKRKGKGESKRQREKAKGIGEGQIVPRTNCPQDKLSPNSKPQCSTMKGKTSTRRSKRVRNAKVGFSEILTKFRSHAKKTFSRLSAIPNPPQKTEKRLQKRLHGAENRRTKIDFPIRDSFREKAHNSARRRRTNTAPVPFDSSWSDK